MKLKTSRLKYQIIIPICIFGAIITATAIYIGMNILRADIKLSLSQRLNTIIDERTAHIETYLNAIKGFTKDAAADQAIADCLSTEGAATPGCTNDELSLYLLKNKFPLTDNLVEMYVLDAAGTEKASSFLNTILGTNLSDSQEFINSQQIPYFSDVYLGSDNGQLMINVAAPVTRNSKFAGIIVSRFRITAVENIIKNPSSLGQTGDAYLVTRDGQRLTSSRFSSQPILEKVDNPNVADCISNLKKYGQGVNDIAENTENPVRYRNTDEKVILGDRGYVASQQWCFLVEMTENEVTEPIDSLSWANAIIGMITMAIITGFAFWIGGRFSRPINDLLQTARQIESGHYQPSTSTYRDNELGQLAATLDIIRQKLQKTQSDNKAKNKNDDTDTAPWPD